MRTEYVAEGHDLAWYLRYEIEVALQVKEDTFFTWVVAPTVIYGRHQVIEQEADVPFCRRHGVQLVQRQSGGGCVYADEGNLMLSFVSPSTHSEAVFARFLNGVAAALRELNYPAVTTQHNDILVNDHKVAGFACYALPTGTIVHACMLYDVDLDMLARALTPSVDKLAKHAVASVRQRVHNLREWQDWGPMPDFRQQISKKITKNLQES